jgi:hypothetical protein
MEWITSGGLNGITAPDAFHRDTRNKLEYLYGQKE